MSRNVVSCTQPAGQGNDVELIPTVQMESQHSVGTPTRRDFPRFVIILQISRPEVRSVDDVHANVDLFEKRPLTSRFSKMFSKRIHHLSDLRLVCKFREIWLTGNRSYIIYRTKKILLALLSLLRGSRPKSVGVSSRQYIRSNPNFIQIRSFPAEL